MTHHAKRELIPITRLAQEPDEAVGVGLLIEHSGAPREPVVDVVDSALDNDPRPTRHAPPSVPSHYDNIVNIVGPGTGLPELPGLQVLQISSFARKNDMSRSPRVRER